MARGRRQSACNRCWEQSDELVNQVFTVFICRTMLPGARRSSGIGARETRLLFKSRKKYIRKMAERLGPLNVSLIRGAKVEDHLAVCMIEDISGAETGRKRKSAVTRNNSGPWPRELSLTEEQNRPAWPVDLSMITWEQDPGPGPDQAGASGNPPPPLTGRAMDEVRRLIEQTIQYTRSLSFELSPPSSMISAFEAAVEWLPN